MRDWSTEVPCKRDERPIDQIAWVCWTILRWAFAGCERSSGGESGGDRGAGRL